MHRDDTGRFAYSASQIERWEATPSDHPVSGGGWVPSATFPPDVISLQQLGGKFEQLRMLSPSAAVFVSIGPWRLEKELPAVVACQPDGVILRLDELQSDQSDGMELAALTRHARRLVDQAGSRQIPLWIVPGPISVLDAVKLIALGASAVAIDQWCDGMWKSAISQDRSRRRPTWLRFDAIGQCIVHVAIGWRRAASFGHATCRATEFDAKHAGGAAIGEPQRGMV